MNLLAWLLGSRPSTGADSVSARLSRRPDSSLQCASASKIKAFAQSPIGTFHYTNSADLGSNAVSRFLPKVPRSQLNPLSSNVQNASGYPAADAAVPDLPAPRPSKRSMCYEPAIRKELNSRRFSRAAESGRSRRYTLGQPRQTPPCAAAL